MDAPTIAEIEEWLRACARASEPTERTDAEGGAADANETAQDQDRPFWPYLESEDFWRE